MINDDSRIMALLEQILDSGCTPEEACRDCPALLPRVRERLKKVQAMAAEVDAVFPAHDGTDGISGEGQHRQRSPARLPNIPGYETLEMLGSGGMGFVYKARHIRLNRIVAIKMLLAGGYAGPRELERFKREAEAVAALRHPNIVQIHDAGEHDGFPYFTMEFMEGGSLSQSIAGTPQPARATAETVATLARAVHAAHACGIVHRDLKPSNVLLTGDKTLKIADFGLAGRMDASQTGVSVDGAALGTPSYMSPEQARGEAHTSTALSPAVDVYALGAILYEMLTGRPPFRGETPLETQRQVIHVDPVPPTRLNPRVPRDLETICLKCLEKEPARRYANATALSDDLMRFEDGRPIQARPVLWTERSWRWGRRNPAAAALLATALALVGLASGGGVWLLHQRTERRTEADRQDLESRDVIRAAVAQAERLRGSFQFREARAVLERAMRPLEGGWRSITPDAHDDLRRQMTQAQADLDLVERLDNVRARLAALYAANESSSAVEPLYASVFADAGLGQIGDDTTAVAARVRARMVGADVVAALDDWASSTPNARHRAWLLDVARKADPDPVRDQLRQPRLWEDRAELARLFRDPEAARISPQLATALGRMASSSDTVRLLSVVQAQYPQDFWLSYELARALQDSTRFDDALGYYRTAVAIRPDAIVARDGVGIALHRLGRNDEAIEELNRAIALDTTSGLAHSWLGFALQEKGRFDEAIDQMRQTVQLYPESAGMLLNLASALNDRGRTDEAIAELEKAIKLDPKQAMAQNLLGNILLKKGRGEEALEHFQKALLAEPDDAVYRMNYGTVLGERTKMDEGILELRRALERDPMLATAHHNLAAMLGTAGRMDEALVHGQKAVDLEPQSAMPHYTLSGLLHDKGRLDEAVDHAQRAVELDPESSPAKMLLSKNLSDAARAALQDALGQGSPARTLSETERSALRAKALGWLRAKIELTVKVRNEGRGVPWPLEFMQTDWRFASVRDSEALAKLPDAERGPWQQFWSDVAAQVAVDPVGDARALAGRRAWVSAAKCFKRSAPDRPRNDGHFWFEYAATSLLAGDHAAYVSICTQIREASGAGEGPRAYHVARACTLAPDGAADMSALARLAEGELQGSADQFWSLTEQGELAFRAGRVEESVSLFERSLQADAMPGRAVVNWAWLALANEKLGKTDDARRWLDKARMWLAQLSNGIPPRAEADLGLHFHNWLEANVVLQEAGAAVKARETPASP